VKKGYRSRFDRDGDSEDLHKTPLVLDEDDLNNQTFEFTLSRHSKTFTGSDSTRGSVSDASEKGEGNESEPPRRVSGHGKVRHIVQSEYVGDGLIGGHHALKMTEIPEPNLNSRKSAPTLFRWM
jgi:hypothetical protein